MKLASIQFNPTVGDLAGNAEKIFTAWQSLQDCDLAITPECSLPGYMCDDLVLNPGFVAANKKHAESLASKIVGKTHLLIGLPWEEGGKVYNAAALLGQGKILQVIHKYELPNYDVFDEKRTFAQAGSIRPIELGGNKIGVMICEDSWFPHVAAQLKKSGAQLLIVINGSPYELNKLEIRKSHIFDRAREVGLPMIYLNMIGGQDEVVFDGGSFACNAQGGMIHQSPQWVEDISVFEFDGKNIAYLPHPNLLPQAGEGAHNLPLPFTGEGRGEGYNEDCHDIYLALCLGIRDYVHKNGFRDVLLGLSGGIDSALVAALAVDALGAKHVRCVMMPSPYTSRESLEDASEIAKLLGVRLDTISISDMMRGAESNIAPIEKLSGLALENLQSRLRGMILMALSNQTGALLLNTGNKSEYATGYATLYGDMCGAFAPLKDVYKTRIFELCRWRNVKSRVIPARVIDKPPTAELRPNQKDEDSLPPYSMLDKILHYLIEEEQGLDHIVAHGYPRDMVLKVMALLDKAEYKRRQAAPGVKISAKAFGRDRRYPITNKYKRTEL